MHGRESQLYHVSTIFYEVTEMGTFSIPDLIFEGRLTSLIKFSCKTQEGNQSNENKLSPKDTAQIKAHTRLNWF